MTSLETLVLLAVDDENELRSPGRPVTCVHGDYQSSCKKTQKMVKCPSAEEMKYRMTRVAIDALDVYFIESGTAIHLWVIEFYVLNFFEFCFRLLLYEFRRVIFMANGLNLGSLLCYLWSKSGNTFALGIVI